MGKKGKTSSILKKELQQAELTMLKQSLELLTQQIYGNINQILVAVTLKLGSIDLQNKTNSENTLQESNRLLKQAVSDLRNLVKDLSSDEIKGRGFRDAILLELDRFCKIGLIVATFRETGEHYILEDNHSDLIIFGIIHGIICRLLLADKILRLHIHVIYHRKEVEINVTFKGSGTKDLNPVIDNILQENEHSRKYVPVTADRNATVQNDEGLLKLLVKRN